MAKQRKKRNGRNGNGNSNGPLAGLTNSPMTPQKLAVITGLLTAALSVDSVLIDKDQRLQIVLGGSLRRKTRMDKLVAELGDYNVSDLLDALANR